MIFNDSLSLYLMILELHKHVVNHKLLILKGKFAGITRDAKKCILCNSANAEDEYHDYIFNVHSRTCILQKSTILNKIMICLALHFIILYQIFQHIVQS